MDKSNASHPHDIVRQDPPLYRIIALLQLKKKESRQGLKVIFNSMVRLFAQGVHFAILIFHKGIELGVLDSYCNDACEIGKELDLIPGQIVYPVKTEADCPYNLFFCDQ